MSKLGPHSRPNKLAVIDGRRAEAKFMRGVKADLVKHCGGAPSATQRMLIDQAAMLTLRLHLMDKASIADPVMSERNSRSYLAWANALSRLLRQLGIRGATERPPTLQELLAASVSTRARSVPTAPASA
jgi:hypothetical protein